MASSRPAGPATSKLSFWATPGIISDAVCAFERITQERNRAGPGRRIGASVALLGGLVVSCGGGRPEAQGHWETAERISPASASEDSTAPSVAIDPNGNATAIWQQERDGTVWAARRPINGAWETPTLLDMQTAPSFGSNVVRAVAMDAAGDAAAIWDRLDGSVRASWSAWGAPWMAPVQLTQPGEVGLDPTVALDPAGAGFAVWQIGRPDQPGRSTRIRARRMVQGRWEPAQELKSASAETGGSPQIAIGNDGSAVVVWHELRNGVFRIWSNHYRRGAGWASAQAISPELRDGAIFPDVSADALGNATAVWNRSPGGPLREIEARRFDVGSGWGPVVSVASGRPYPGFPRVAVDASGNALAVWLESPDSGTTEVRAAWFSAGSGWGAAQRLQTPTAFGADAPRVAMDARGNGIVVWRRGDGDQRIIWAARFEPSGGWKQPEAIGAGPSANVEIGPVAVAVSPAGDGIAAWQQSDGGRLTIWANRFAANGPAPSPR